MRQIVLIFLFLGAVLSATAIAAPEPLKGLVLWPDEARDRPDLSEAISLEFAYCLPCDIVKGMTPDGVLSCDWSKFEALLAGIASRGHQAVIRFRYAYPGEVLGGVRGATAVPAFIKRRPDYHETFAANPDGDGPTAYPDWSCRALEEFTLAFYRVVAERYDRDPRLAFLEVGFGHWAEYHTSGTKTRLGVNFPSQDFQKRFFATLDGLFHETPWLISIDAANREWSSALEVKASFGLFDDSFMHKEHDLAQGDGYNETCFKAFGERWRKAPCGGEISYFSKRDQREFLSPKGLYGVTWREAAAKYHITFMIANDALSGKFATKDTFLSAANVSGYRLALVSRTPTPEGVRVVIANKGVAPVYHDMRVALGDRRSSESLRGLQPGESRTVTILGGAAAEKVKIVSDKFLPGTSFECLP